MPVDENPYKAPQSGEGGSSPKSRFWARFLDLVLLIVVAVVVVFLMLRLTMPKIN